MLLHNRKKIKKNKNVITYIDKKMEKSYNGIIQNVRIVQKGEIKNASSL